MSSKFYLVAAAAAAVGFAMSPVAAPSAHADVMIAGISASLCMDLNMTTNKVALWTCSGSYNQNFFTSAYGQQTLNGKCLDADGAGTDMYMAACNTARPSQKWAIDNNGEWKNEGGWCADIPFQIAYQGQRIQMHTCNGGKNQTWGRGRFQAGGATGIIAGQAAGSIFYGGAKIGQMGTPIVASGAGNIVAAGAGNIVAAGAGNIINMNGGKIVK